MRLRSLLIPFIYSVLPVSTASAQFPLHLSFGGGLTPAFQTDAVSRGYSGAHLEYALDFTPASSHWGLRFDAFTHHMSRNTFGGALRRETKILGADFSALYSFGPATRSWTPYLIAGAGTYRTEYGEPTPEWHFGLAGGAGLRLRAGPVGLFLESRVHSIADGSTPYLVPVTIGLRF